MKKSSRKAFALATGLIVGTWGATAALGQEPTSALLYDLTFNGEPLGGPPATHVPGAAAPRTRVSSVFDENGNGSVNVVATHGPLTDTPLEFVAFGGAGSVPGVDRNWIILRTDDFATGLVPADGIFTAQGEVTIDAGAGVNSSVGITMDDPTGNPGFRPNLLFNGETGLVSATLGGETPTLDQIRPFAFGTRILFRVETDVAARTYRIFVDGSLLGSGVFGGTTIASVRITVGKSAVESSIAAAVDNVLVSVSPQPTEAFAAGVLYDVDFEDPPHIAGGLPALHEPGAAPVRDAVSRIEFGSPTVVAAFPPFTSQALEFDSRPPGDGTPGEGDQIALDLEDFAGGMPPNGFYVVEADLVIAEIDAGSFFRIFLDTPVIRRVEFGSDGRVRAFIPGVLDPPVDIGAYAPGSIIKVRIAADVALDTWTIFLDGVQRHSGSFGGALGITGVRFSTPVADDFGGALAAVDNVVVTVATTPPTEFAACPFDEATVAADCGRAQSGFYIVHSITDTVSPPAACPCPEGSPNPVVTRPCVDGPGPDRCWSDTAIVRRANGETIVNISRNPQCTIYCYSLDGIRICQEFCL